MEFDQDSRTASRGDVEYGGDGSDTLWLNVKGRGLDRVRGCERVSWVIPTIEQEADEDQG